MDLHEARKLALDLMGQHGLGGWSFAFDHARRRFGCCRPSIKLITLSRMLTFLNDAPSVRETILHEIAHGLTPGDGHGYRWRQQCRDLGIDAHRCFDEQVKTPTRAPAAYLMVCKTCNWWADRRRLSGVRLVCRTCRRPVVYRHKLNGTEFIAGEKR